MPLLSGKASPALRSSSRGKGRRSRKNYTAVVERSHQNNLYVGFIPGFPGAHSQGKMLEELNHNLQEVIAMLLSDGEPELESEFVGVLNVPVTI